LIVNKQQRRAGLRSLSSRTPEGPGITWYYQGHINAIPDISYQNEREEKKKGLRNLIEKVIKEKTI